MIGIFDSGVGGFASLRRLRELCPNLDVCYLADRKNAPYGTKTAEKLKELVLRDINILREAGASNILAACCTASAVIDAMSDSARRSVTTIITPTARAAARRTKNKKIALLCTYATARSSAFERAILRIDSEIEVRTQPSKRLVELAERGARDGNLSNSELAVLREEVSPLLGFGADTVILGCTHFSHLRAAISDYLGADFVSAADEGAELMARTVGNVGNGKTIYICPDKVI